MSDESGTGARVTLCEANQRFAALIREVERGSSYVITRHGRPVAHLSPVDGRRLLTPAQEAARERTRRRMRDAKAVSAPWRASREDLYAERLDDLERRRGS